MNTNSVLKGLNPFTSTILITNMPWNWNIDLMGFKSCCLPFWYWQSPCFGGIQQSSATVFRSQNIISMHLKLPTVWARVMTVTERRRAKVGRALGPSCVTGLTRMPILFTVVAEQGSASRTLTGQLGTTGTTSCYYDIPGKETQNYTRQKSLWMWILNH